MYNLIDAVANSETECDTKAKEVAWYYTSNILVEDNEAPKAELSICNMLTGEYVTEYVAIDELNKEKFKKLILKNGGVCTCPDAQFKKLKSEYFKSLIDKSAHIIKIHKDLGWKNSNGTNVFLGHNKISLTGEESGYRGNIDVSPVGNTDELVAMIDKWIIGCSEWSPLEAVISFSVAATILPFIRLVWGMELDNPIIHIIGGSTTGKSTALKMHVSFGSDFTNRKRSFLISFESSLVSIIHRIGQNWGFPVSIDELSAGSRKSYDEFIYTLGNGEEKDRLKAGGIGLQESATFSTVVMTSGEISMHRKCSNNEGIRGRCFEIPNVHWTESKEQSVAIIECLRNNHGLITPLVAEEMLKNSDFWHDRWNEISNKVHSKILDDKVYVSITPRVADFVTLFTMAAEVVNKIFSIKLNVDAIFKFCYDYIIIANAEEANLAERAYACIMGHFSNNLALYPDGELYGCKDQYNGYSLQTEEEGFHRDAARVRKVMGKELNKQVVFRKSSIERILDEGGFSVKVALNKLKEANLLATKDRARCTNRATINGVEQDVVVVYYKNDADDAIVVNDIIE